MKNYYTILGLSSNCSQEDIKKAYRKLARDSHPDSCGNEDSSNFRSIQEAYEIIGTAEKRKAYDQELQQEQFQNYQAAPTYTIRFEDNEIYSPLSLENWFDRILDNMFQMDFHPLAFSGLDQQLELILTRDEAQSGGIFPIRVPVRHICASCRGKGSNRFYFCDACQGHGHIIKDEIINLRIPPAIKSCSNIRIPIQGYGILTIMIVIH